MIDNANMNRFTIHLTHLPTRIAGESEDAYDQRRHNALDHIRALRNAVVELNFMRKLVDHTDAEFDGAAPLRHPFGGLSGPFAEPYPRVREDYISPGRLARVGVATERAKRQAALERHESRLVQVCETFRWDVYALKIGRARLLFFDAEEARRIGERLTSGTEDNDAPLQGVPHSVTFLPQHKFTAVDAVDAFCEDTYGFFLAHARAAPESNQ